MARRSRWKRKLDKLEDKYAKIIAQIVIAIVLGVVLTRCALK